MIGDMKDVIDSTGDRMSIKIKIKKLHEDAIVPKYKTKGSAGFDLYALEDVSIDSQETQLIKTGLSFEIPEGFVLDIRPRSGMSLKTTFRIANSPGTIDSDYRGEVCVIGQNTFVADGAYHRGPLEINKGDRIAQGVLICINKAEFEIVEELSDTERGERGFGSTGNNE